MLSENIIKDIHSLILADRPQDKGKYRRIPVTITGAIHEPPQPYIIPKLIEDVIGIMKKLGTSNIIERVSIFHLEFEAIHPFIDGNSRTGRLILNFELMKKGYPPINIKFKDRKEYYDCFTDYHLNNKDPSMLIGKVKMYVKKELKKYISILETTKNI
jgi:Fic family protein